MSPESGLSDSMAGRLRATGPICKIRLRERRPSSGAVARPCRGGGRTGAAFPKLPLRKSSFPKGGFRRTTILDTLAEMTDCGISPLDRLRINGSSGDDRHLPWGECPLLRNAGRFRESAVGTRRGSTGCRGGCVSWRGSRRRRPAPPLRRDAPQVQGADVIEGAPVTVPAKQWRRREGHSSGMVQAMSGQAPGSAGVGSRRICGLRQLRKRGGLRASSAWETRGKEAFP